MAQISQNDVLDLACDLLEYPRGLSRFLEVVDTDGDLFVVHYKRGLSHRDNMLVEKARGVVIDYEAKIIVCPSFGYTPVVCDDNLDLGELDECEFKHYHEGAVIRVFLFNGVVYYATHRRLNFSVSRWGSSKSFLEMYQSLGGPQKDDLFTKGALYSPHCHFFLLSHHDIFVGEQDDVPDRLIYLGSMQSQQVDENFDDEESDNYVAGGEVLICPKMSPTVVPSKSLTHAEALEEIKSRGCVIAKLRNGSYRRVISSYFFKRMEIRGDDPNLYHRLVVLLDDAKLNNETFAEKYGNWNGSKEKMILEKFLQSVPFNRKTEVATFLDRYEQDRIKLINFLECPHTATELSNSKKIFNVWYACSRGENVAKMVRGMNGLLFYACLTDMRNLGKIAK